MGKFKETYRTHQDSRAMIGSSIALEDNAKKIQGYVRIYTKDHDDERKLHCERALVSEGPNKIVTLARKAMTHLVADGDTDYQITKFEAGTGGHAPGDPLTPVDPVVGDTALETSFWGPIFITLPPTYLPLVEESNVTFTIHMERTDGNDVTPVEYTEAGLFSTNGNLFARQTFPAVVKTDTRSVIFEWLIYF